MQDVEWKRVRFRPSSADALPTPGGGIYTFVVEPDVAGHACAYLTYVGMVEDRGLRARFREYLREGEQRKPRARVVSMLKRWKGHLWFHYIELASAEEGEIEALESDLIDALQPPCNDRFSAEIGWARKSAF